VGEDPKRSAGPRGLRSGSQFGHYRLRCLLGEGGFGQVWEADDTVMDRVVALKLLRSQYSENEKFRQRLLREARAAGRLHEPHVVPIHHCGEIDGQLYIDMRLIKGTDLQSVLAKGGALTPVRTVEIVRQVAAALDAAHSDQLVHRDVKPANVLLTDDDFACLVDFGLANAATDAKLTSSGTTIGTFAYMAPERLSNAEVTHRVDVYALACVLYECLTGSPPYGVGDLAALIAAHLTAPIPRPSQRRPRIPVGFDDVIARGMAKKPDDRYRSAGELAAAAQRALSAAQSAGSRSGAAASGRGRVPSPVKPAPANPSKAPSAKPGNSPAATRRRTAQPHTKANGAVGARLPVTSPTRTSDPTSDLPFFVEHIGAGIALAVGIGIAVVAIGSAVIFLLMPSSPDQPKPPDSWSPATTPSPPATSASSDTSLMTTPAPPPPSSP